MTKNELICHLSTLLDVQLSTLADLIEKNSMHHVLNHPYVYFEKATADKVASLSNVLQGLAEFNAMYYETTLSSSAKSGKFCIDFFQLTMGIEHFYVFFLNASNSLIDTYRIKGSLSEVAVYPSEILKIALNICCKSVIIAHNHPGGSFRFSHADQDLTRKLKSALELVGIGIVDHILVIADQYISMAESGMM